MRLADAPVLPFEFGRFGVTISRYLDEIEKLPNLAQPELPTSPRCGARFHACEKNAADFDAAYARYCHAWLRHVGRPTSQPLTRFCFRPNAISRATRGLPGLSLVPDGHRIYALGKYTGYDAKTLPGIREAVESGHLDEAREQAEQVAQVLRKLNDEIAQAQKRMGEL